jgi:hypothetical protein
MHVDQNWSFDLEGKKKIWKYEPKFGEFSK